MTADPYRVRVSGPLAQHGRDLASELMRRGYGRERAARHVQLLAQLSRWLDGQGLAACDLSEDAAAQFLAARAAAGYAEKYSTRWMLRLLGCVPALTLVRAGTPGAATPAAAVPEAHRGYPARQRCPAARTITGYLAVARLFLARWERPDCLDLQPLSARQVHPLVLDQ